MLTCFEPGIHNENILMALIRNIKLMCVHIFCFLSGYNHGKNLCVCSNLFTYIFIASRLAKHFMFLWS